MYIHIGMCVCVRVCACVRVYVCSCVHDLLLNPTQPLRISINQISSRSAQSPG